MVKNLWLNLPIKDLDRSRAFFTAIGFRFKDGYTGNGFLCMEVGDPGVAVNMWTHEVFKGFCSTGIANPADAPEVLLSFDAQSRAEVDEMAQKVRDAGGEIFAEPKENQGWMYGFGFKDPDGHRWNMLYMDMSKLPKK